MGSAVEEAGGGSAWNREEHLTDQGLHTNRCTRFFAGSVDTHGTEGGTAVLREGYASIPLPHYPI